MKKILFLSLFFISFLFAKVYENIEFKGVKGFGGELSRDTLLKVIGKEYPPFYAFWRDDPVFRDSEIDDYLKRLKKYFASIGYYKADFKVERKKNTLIIVINKNEPIRVKSLNIDGNRSIRNLIPFKVGDIFRTDLFKQSKDSIERFLLTHSYPKYDFKAKAYVDLDLYRVDLNYTIKNGPFCYFGHTEINGGGDVDEKILREQIVYKEKDPFNIEKVEETYDNFYNLAVYDYILVEPNLEINSTTIPVKVDLKMGDTRFLKAGIGYGTNDGLRGEISWKDNDFFGNLKQFETGLKASSSLGYEYFARYYDRWVELPIINRVTFEDRFSLSYKKYKSYNERKAQNRATLGKKFWGLEHYFGLLTEFSKLHSKTKTRSYEDGNYFLNSLFYRVVIDRRNSIFDATEGYYLSLYLEKSMPALGSDLSYLKTLIDARYIHDFKKFIGAVKVRVGSLNEDVPLFKRFYTGGSFTNRGYAYRDFGPKDSEGVPLGGLSLIDILSEVRYPLNPKFSVVAFYDTSMLCLKPNSFRHAFYGSWGFGMRYKTPIGPIRVDIGFPVRDSGWEFHINIGQVF